MVNKQGGITTVGLPKPPNIKGGNCTLSSRTYVRKKSNQGKIKVNFGNYNKISEGRYDNYVNGKKKV